MHSGDNKDPSPYTAIKSNDIMDFLGNPNRYEADYYSIHCNSINVTPSINEPIIKADIVGPYDKQKMKDCTKNARIGLCGTTLSGILRK